MLLDRFLPRWHFRERHTISVEASPEYGLEAVKRLTPDDVPLVGRLMRLRSLPAHFTRGEVFSSQSNVPFLSQIVGQGFFLLGEEPERELVLGTIGRFWKPTGEFCLAIRTPDEFLRFEEPGWVKVGWNFSIEQSGSGCTLQTETRILATSRDARMKFLLYWIIVRPGSGMIRKAILRAVKTHLEKHKGF